MERVAYCHLIAKVLAADGIMDDSERAFLKRAMEKMGLSEQERDEVIHFEGGENAEKIMRSATQEERRELVDELVNAALVDGKLSPHETEIVKRITEALDL